MNLIKGEAARRTHRPRLDGCHDEARCSAIPHFGPSKIHIEQINMKQCAEPFDINRSTGVFLIETLADGSTGADGGGRGYAHVWTAAFRAVSWSIERQLRGLG